MGIDPGDTFTYWLPDDASKPEAERRGVVYRHGTVRHWRQFAADREAVVAGSTIDTIDARLVELASRGVVRCINLQGIEDLTAKELVYLTGNLRHAAWLGEFEKKA